MFCAWAAPDGTGDGLSSSTPCSLAAAKELAQAHAATDDVLVILLAGTYQLAAGIVFGAADGGQNGHMVTWRAEGEVIFSGGVQVTGWTLHDAGANIWRASVPAGLLFRQMYVDGVRRNRVRGKWSLSSSDAGATYVSTDPTFPVLARPQDLEMVFPRAAFNWVESRLCAASASRVGDTTTITMRYPGGINVRWIIWPATWPAQPGWAENAYEFLSASTPGQWYLDPGTDTLYYVPMLGEDMDAVDVRVPVVEQLLSCSAADPVSNIRFQGISFQHATWTRPSVLGCFLETFCNDHWDTAWGPANGPLHFTKFPPAAVSLAGSQNAEIVGCDLRHLGARGIYLGGGARGCFVRRNTVTDASSSGICIGDVDTFQPAHPTGDIHVDSNVIRNVAVEYRAAPGLFGGIVDHVYVWHNEISDLPYTGIVFGYGQEASGYMSSLAAANDIAGNYVHDVMLVLNDGGGIYTEGMQTSGGLRTVIHHNLIENVGPGGSTTYANPIYLDESTHGVDATHNVCLTRGQPYWYNENGDFGNCTATVNYANGNMVRHSTSPNALTGIDEAIVLGGDPATWPAEALAIIAAAGPAILRPPVADLSLSGAPRWHRRGWEARGLETSGLAQFGAAGGQIRLRMKVWSTALGRWQTVPMKRYR